MNAVTIDDEAAYRALRGRDARFDGAFIAAVSSTGIYCRPSCPARTPLRRNVSFYPSAAAAQRAGFRACKRCRPDATPGSADFNARADLAARAARLIADGAVDRVGVSGVARQLGYSERQVGRALMSELGAPALALARAQRARSARTLLENTSMPAGDIAFAAGFGSIRQFNETMQSIFACSPTELRHGSRRGGPQPVAASSEIDLRLAYRPPMDLSRSLRFLAGRQIAGVESYDGHSYWRTLRLPYGDGAVSVGQGAAGQGSAQFVRTRLWLTDHRDLAAAVARIRRWLDLDADPVAIDATLAEQPVTARLAQDRPGLRSVGCADGFEMAVRAVVGQQISVRAAMRILGGLVERFGQPCPAAASIPSASSEDDIDGAASSGDNPNTRPSRLFPRADVIAEIDPASLPMPRARGRAVVAIAAAVASGAVQLDAGADRGKSRDSLLRLPGIGPWTADYLMMRALGDPDVYLAADLAVKRGAAGQPGLEPDRARPWRSYLTHHLWAVHLDN